MDMKCEGCVSAVQSKLETLEGNMLITLNNKRIYNKCSLFVCFGTTEFLVFIYFEFFSLRYCTRSEEY